LATPDQIQEQVQLEREAIKCGIDKIHKNTEQLIEKEYASATVFGCSSIKSAQSLVADEILNTFRKNVIEGKNGAAYADIANHLLQFNTPEDANILANIALKRTFDLVFSIKRKESRKYPNTISNVCVSVGASVEGECQIRWYEQQDPKLLKRVRDKYWLNTTGTGQKRKVAQIMFNREDYHWDTWSADLRARLGGWLVGIVCDVTNWFEKQVTLEGKPRLTLLVPTDEYMLIQEQLMQEAMLFAPMSWPMLIEPNDWTNDHAGGYLLNEVQRGNELVRRGDPTIRQPDTPLAFLNKLQKVAYHINPFVYGVAKQLDEKGYKVGKFKPLSHAALWEFPLVPLDIATNEESRKKYKEERTDAENRKKAYERSMHVRTSITLELADRFIKRDKFYCPWSFDYRGRAYPIPPFLSPQDTDFGKSLLRFADESFLTYEAEEWLAFQVATTFGLDKEPIHKRLQWAKDNESLISSVAEDPLRCLSLWEEADEPWQFLAACDEYYHCLIACDRMHTGLPIAVDATCSGLQILAGLARDADTARLVNVLPGDKPQDAYREVARCYETSIYS
jgi:DNA-directed RNA polymerase